MCNGEQNETFAEWEARMDASGAKAPKGPAVDWVIDGHGHWVDPAKDVMDDVAKRRVAERERS
jgi:hypothetical protein